MAARRIPREIAAEAVELVRKHGTTSAAARAVKISRSTLEKRLYAAFDIYEMRDPRKNTNQPLEQGQGSDVAELEWEAPILPSDGIPTPELIEQRVQAFQRRQKAKEARRWMPFKVKLKGPFALAFFGDPHLDDNGCDWPQLRDDMNTLVNTEAMYGIGMGDYTNAWSGRLTKIYAHQEVTQSQAWQLAEWFFGAKKPNGQSAWWLLIKGNHDLWSGKHGTGDVLDWLCRGTAALEDWQCRFEVHAGDRSWRVHAAHDFPGSSIYNPLHAPMRKGRFAGADADIYICGHRHNWAVMEVEHEDHPGSVYWAARCKGYKAIDPHADHSGYGSQHYGATITVVFDPATEGPRSLRAFPDMQDAADYLAFKRART